MDVRFPTVPHMLAHAVAVSPEREALVFEGRRLTYRRYADAVAMFAHELQAAGCAGERVATLLPNSIEACIGALAVLACGAQHVPLNPLYTARELGEILDDAAPRLLIVDAALAERAAPLAAKAGASVVVVGPSRRLLDDVEGVATGERPALPLPDPDALALLQYTGGTTGRSKGVNLTHRAIATNVAQREALLPIAPDRERVLCAMPLFHSYAMAMGLFLAVYSRASLVILPRYRPEEVLAIVARERISFFPGSPTIFTGLMAHPDFAATDWSTVHTCYSGSAALPEETLRRWRDAVGAPVYEGYGQTEAGPILSQNPLDAPRAGTVGIALPDTEIEIVDTEAGERVLPIGERGEIRARGPQIMLGYRNLPDETARALRDGWLYTGDIGEFGVDGYLTIRDRKKDMLIVGGYNVYPREVEEVLLAHPAVQEAAVIGEPDAYRGEVPIAFLVLRAGSPRDIDGIARHCAGNLARYKLPGRFEVLDAMPRTTVNKIDKPALRARARGSS